MRYYIVAKLVDDSIPFDVPRTAYWTKGEEWSSKFEQAHFFKDEEAARLTCMALFRDKNVRSLTINWIVEPHAEALERA